MVVINLYLRRYQNELTVTNVFFLFPSQQILSLPSQQSLSSRLYVRNQPEKQVWRVVVFHDTHWQYGVDFQ